MYHKTTQTINEITMTKKAITQVSLTQMQLKNLNVRDLDTPPNTYYLENIDESTLPQVNNYKITNQMILTSRDKVGQTLDQFFLLQDSYRKSIETARSISRYLEENYVPVKNSELTTIYLDLHAQIVSLPGAIMQELEMLKENEEISVGSLNEAIILSKTSYTQLEGVCLPADIKGDFNNMLAGLVDDMQKVLKDGEGYFDAQYVALNTLDLLNSTIETSDKNQTASNHKSSIILLTILAGLIGVLGLTFYTIMRSRNFMLMNAASKEDLEAENLLTIKNSVEHLIESVNETWMDSKNEARLVNDMTRDTKNIDQIIGNFEAELNNVHDDSKDIHAIRKQVESLYQTSEDIKKNDLLPIVKLICDLEINIYQHEDELHSDVEAMGNTAFSIRNDLDDLQRVMNKLIHDTQELKDESESLEENKVMIDLWDS